jgi:hypothetical protein
MPEVKPKTGSIRKLDDLTGFPLSARGGEIGTLREVYFDSEHWVVRYFVVGTGSWLRRRPVLIAPRAVRGVSDSGRSLEVELSREQVEGSPPTDLEVIVSRHYEELYHRHYGWEPYWTDPSGKGSLTPEPPRAWPEQEVSGELPNPNLRSSDEVGGYHIHAKDGSIGHVEDLLIDDAQWRVRYLEVDTRNWWPGRKVLIAPAWIEGMSRAKREFLVKVTREAVRSAPEYDPSRPIGPDGEIQLFEHYGLSAAEKE